MSWILNFIGKNSHEIFCWSWAVGICGLLLIVMMLIDTAWNLAYKKGYGEGFEKGYEAGSDSKTKN